MDLKKIKNELMEITEIAKKTEGCLKDREVRFLYFIASVIPKQLGQILEIGSFKGKSTVILANAIKNDSNCIINAVDPMINTTKTDPYSKEEKNLENIFYTNLKNNNVEEKVKLHKMKSIELVPEWNSKLKFLWIDGDHTYNGTLIDFEGFSPWLSNGGVVAIHDVLNEFEGSLRVFIEKIVLSPEYGPCGLCGSIGWGQKIDKKDLKKYMKNKIKLYKKLSKMVPYTLNDELPKGLNKKKYKFFRSFVPNREPNYQEMHNILNINF